MPPRGRGKAPVAPRCRGRGAASDTDTTDVDSDATSNDGADDVYFGAAGVRLNDPSSTSLCVSFLGHTFELAQDPASNSHASVVWDGAIALLRWLEHNPSEAQSLRGASVLELGAGTGLVGIALAHALQCRVVLTDLPDVAAGSLAANVAALPLPPGSSGSMAVLPYAWDGAVCPTVLAAGGGAFGIVVGTDVAYSETLNAVLLRSAVAFAHASDAAARGGAGAEGVGVGSCVILEGMGVDRCAARGCAPGSSEAVGGALGGNVAEGGMTLSIAEAGVSRASPSSSRGGFPAAAAAPTRTARRARCRLLFANELRCHDAQAVFDAEAARLGLHLKRIPARRMHPEWRAANMLLFDGVSPAARERAE